MRNKFDCFSIEAESWKCELSLFLLLLSLLSLKFCFEISIVISETTLKYAIIATLVVAAFN